MVDAAANYVAQIRIALMVDDKSRALHALEQAERLLFDATRKIEEDRAAVGNETKTTNQKAI